MRVGVDIVENNRLRDKLNSQFLQHFLTGSELKRYKELKSENSRLSFVSGRWAVKEAIFKTLSASAKRGLSKIEIGYDLNQAPIVLSPGLEHIQISISHENNYSVAVALNPQD